ncbi:tRNA 4-thiouridine(8) synthase ThiI [Patescibacteria group bacterium]|nr:tRNA 4-thiouridine(8) synthase ThiI [Patescibacteria group bacterium]
MYIICHYDEIGIKGKNRRFFEEKLVTNIQTNIDNAFFVFIKRISGRIIVKLSSKGEKNIVEITTKLKDVFGLAYFAFAYSAKQDIESIQTIIFELIEKKKFKTFRVLTQRSKKDFPMLSPDINKNIAVFLLKKMNKKKINLTNPDLTCFIEIVEKYAFIYFEKIICYGGLPVGVSGRALSLISGGIDSPVASYLMAKRGVELIFIHFHAYPYTNKESVDKVIKVIQVLSKAKNKAKLYLVPFADVQQEIFLKCPGKLRVVLYRIFMLRIAEQVATKEKIIALVTGENLGQVASQTIANMAVINNAIDLLIFRPLVGKNKQAIINLAKQINTYEISILPDQDCCSRFLPKHPATKSNIKEVDQAIKKLKIKKLIKLALKNTTIKYI